MLFMIKVILFAFSVMAVLLFSMGVSGSEGLIQDMKPSYSSPGSMARNSTGRSRSVAMAAATFPIFFLPCHSAPAAAPDTAFPVFTAPLANWAAMEPFCWNSSIPFLSSPIYILSFLFGTGGSFFTMDSL